MEKYGNMIDIFTRLSWCTIIFPCIFFNWKFNIDLGCSRCKEKLFIFLETKQNTNKIGFFISHLKMNRLYVFFRTLFVHKFSYFYSLMRKRTYSFRLIQIRFVTSKASDVFFDQYLRVHMPILICVFQQLVIA